MIIIFLYFQHKIIYDMYPVLLHEMFKQLFQRKYIISQSLEGIIASDSWVVQLVLGLNWVMIPGSMSNFHYSSVFVKYP